MSPLLAMMCKWGTLVEMELEIPAHLSHKGVAYRKPVGIDACIAPIVKALNDGGIATIASCCGHGKGPGSIVLGDYRELIVAEDHAQARQVMRGWSNRCAATSASRAPTPVEEEEK